MTRADGRAMRVVSLVPSVTETLLAWGVDVVACTRFCEQPALRHVGGTKNPDLPAIAELAPDLVVVDREENRREDAEAMVELGLRLHVTDVVHVEDVEPTLDALAAAVRADRAGAALAAPAEPWTTAFVPIWRRPWMSISDDTYGGSLLARLGVANVLGGSVDRYPSVELEEVASLAPEFVLVPSEPYEFKPAHLVELRDELPNSAIVPVDGQDLFWWGVRTPVAINRLSAALRRARPPS